MKHLPQTLTLVIGLLLVLLFASNESVNSMDAIPIGFIGGIIITGVLILMDDNASSKT